MMSKDKAELEEAAARVEFGKRWFRPESQYSVEEYVVFCALQAMVNDVHSPQDNLTKKQWDVAEKVLAELTKKIDGGILR